MKNITIQVMTGLLCLVFNLNFTAQNVTAQNTSTAYSIPLDDDYQTNAKLVRPEKAEVAQDLVIMFHGSGPYDMDTTVPDGQGGVLSENFRVISDHLATNQISSLRFHKRGVLGDGNYDFAQVQKAMQLSQLLSDAEQVLDFALELPDIDQIYLFGWSEGTWVASHLAAKRSLDVAGIVLQAPPNSALASIVETQHVLIGLPYLSEKIDQDKNGALSINEILSIPAGPVQLMPQFYMWDRSSSPTAPVLNKRTDADGDGEINLETELRPIIEQTITMMAQMPSEVSPIIAEVLHNVSVPVAILHGDMDGWVPASESVAIKSALKDVVTLFRYPNLGHALSPTPDLAEDSFDRIEEAPLNDMVTWISRH